MDIRADKGKKIKIKKLRRVHISIFIAVIHLNLTHTGENFVHFEKRKNKANRNISVNKWLILSLWWRRCWEIIVSVVCIKMSYIHCWALVGRNNKSINVIWVITPWLDEAGVIFIQTKWKDQTTTFVMEWTHTSHDRINYTWTQINVYVKTHRRDTQLHTSTQKKKSIVTTHPENSMKVLSLTLFTYTQKPFVNRSCVYSAVELII